MQNQHLSFNTFPNKHLLTAPQQWEKRNWKKTSTFSGQILGKEVWIRLPNTFTTEIHDSDLSGVNWCYLQEAHCSQTVPVAVYFLALPMTKQSTNLSLPIPMSEVIHATACNPIKLQYRRECSFSISSIILKMGIVSKFLYWFAFLWTPLSVKNGEFIKMYIYIYLSHAFIEIVHYTFLRHASFVKNASLGEAHKVFHWWLILF